MTSFLSHACHHWPCASGALIIPDRVILPRATAGLAPVERWSVAQRLLNNDLDDFGALQNVA